MGITHVRLSVSLPIVFTVDQQWPSFFVRHLCRLSLVRVDESDHYGVDQADLKFHFRLSAWTISSLLASSFTLIELSCMTLLLAVDDDNWCNSICLCVLFWIWLAMIKSRLIKHSSRAPLVDRAKLWKSFRTILGDFSLLLSPTIGRLIKFK